MLVIGLGNPGTAYKHTYHNLGFEVLDLMRKQLAFPPFRNSVKLKSLVSKKGDVVLAKPQTFMNRSGEAASRLVKTYRSSRVLIVHDEIDLPQNKMRVSKNSGSAGHKGVESVMQHLKTGDIARIRIGIQPTAGKPADLEGFVLKRFKQEEFEPILKEAVELLEGQIKENEG